MSILIGSEISARSNAVQSQESRRVRRLFNGRTARTAEDQGDLKRRRSNKFLVRGRHVSGNRVIWDVYEICDDSLPNMIGEGFAFKGEAIAFARDRSLGRLAVSFGGVRGLFRGGSGVLVPDKKIEKPGESVVPIKNSSDGSVIVG